MSVRRSAAFPASCGAPGTQSGPAITLKPEYYNSIRTAAPQTSRNEDEIHWYDASSLFDIKFGEAGSQFTAEISRSGQVLLRATATVGPSIDSAWDTETVDKATVWDTGGATAKGKNAIRQFVDGELGRLYAELDSKIGHSLPVQDDAVEWHASRRFFYEAMRLVLMRVSDEVSASWFSHAAKAVVLEAIRRFCMIPDGLQRRTFAPTPEQVHETLDNVFGHGYTN